MTWDTPSSPVDTGSSADGEALEEDRVLASGRHSTEPGDVADELVRVEVPTEPPQVRRVFPQRGHPYGHGLRNVDEVGRGAGPCDIDMLDLLPRLSHIREDPPLAASRHASITARPVAL